MSVQPLSGPVSLTEGQVGVHATVLYLNPRPARGNDFLLFPFISELLISVTAIEHIRHCQMSADSSFCIHPLHSHSGFSLNLSSPELPFLPENLKSQQSEVINSH